MVIVVAAEAYRDVDNYCHGYFYYYDYFYFSGGG